MSSFIWGASASLAASLIFLFIVLIFLAPKVKISEFIGKRPAVVERGEDAGKPTYVFKFVNMSYFPLFDINIELFQLERIPIGKKFNIRYKKLELKQSTIKYVHGYWYWGEVNRCGTFAVLPKLNNDLEGLMKEDRHILQLQITGRHGLTGLSRVFKQDFTTSGECIVHGRHKNGRSLRIHSNSS